MGRFINADALIDSGHDLLGHNLFAYCNNNAVNMVDPDGYSPFWDLLTSNLEAFSLNGLKHSVKAGCNNVIKSYTNLTFEEIQVKGLTKTIASALAIAKLKKPPVPPRASLGQLTKGLTRVKVISNIKVAKKLAAKGVAKTIVSTLIGPLFWAPEIMFFLNGFEKGYLEYNSDYK